MSKVLFAPSDGLLSAVLGLSGVQAKMTATTVSSFENEVPEPEILHTVQAVDPEVMPKAPMPQPAHPVRLTVPVIGIGAPIVTTGLTAEGKMAVPDNFTEIGWYSSSVRPGAPGTAVMGAHVDNGSSINGVFKRLRELKIGDMVHVSDANGATYKYRVISQKIYGYKDRNVAEVFFSDSGDKTSRLHLITCTGRWLPRENTYDSRLVVFAELVQS